MPNRVYTSSDINLQKKGKQHIMKTISPQRLAVLVLTFFLTLFCFTGAALSLETLAKDPYLGAIVIDAATGDVIAEDQADVKGYPASMVKLMNLMIVLDTVKAGHTSLQEPVTISGEVSRIGGSQVYLKENEVFPVEELIYAMMVQSANDAALALAIHCAGTAELFVEMMNKKAGEIGMKNTVFHSVHGLPPGKDQQPDVTTARDMALLCRALLSYPETLTYTATRERKFRPEAKEPFIMRTHNHLLQNFEGCDGFKTGFYGAAGFSISATAQKKQARAIAVVLGSAVRQTRDEKARLLLSRGLTEILRKQSTPTPTPAPVASTKEKTSAAPAKAEEKPVAYVQIPKGTFIIALIANFLVMAGLVFALLAGKKRSRRF